ncbi:hypothetical protein GCM10010191_36880 [Actinomadura vinacea]|uniref:DUF2510 domain-containing protein n=1 Tax=Actinomadura vinacea TaxID=115336 RepID=A0ABN3J4Y2_9ACTN
MSQPGWYPDPQGSGSLRWWNGDHWTEHLNPEPPASRRPDPPAAPAWQPVSSYQRPVDAIVRGALLRADEHAVTYAGVSMPWAHVEWVAYWAATAPGGHERAPAVQWIFQVGRHPFHGGPRVEVVFEDVAVHVPGRADATAEAVWRDLVELCRMCAEQRLVDELARRVRDGDAVDVAHGLSVHPGGVRGGRVSLSWSAIAGAVLEDGRVWIRQSAGTAPVLYVPQQNPNAVLIPALLAVLRGS